MEAMIFAAGVGSRLGELTDRIPKALIPVGGVAMLERVARRLIQAGVQRLIINTHHLGDQIVEYVRQRADFGVEVVFSREVEQRLETGGGLRHAAGLFRESSPFFIHNSDVLTDLPLEALYAAHGETGALATVATMRRETSRRLLFDDRGLFGRVDDGRDLRIEVRDPVGEVEELGFAGVHVASAQLRDLITEEGVFSILDPYLRLAGEGYGIRSFPVDGYRWIDIGKPEQLAAAADWKE